MNNYSNIFIEDDTLNSLSCFFLDIEVHGISNYRTNYLLHKCRKKASKWDSWGTCILTVTFRERAIDYESQ